MMRKELNGRNMDKYGPDPSESTQPDRYHEVVLLEKMSTNRTLITE